MLDKTLYIVQRKGSIHSYVANTPKRAWEKAVIELIRSGTYKKPLEAKIYEMQYAGWHIIQVNVLS